MTCAASALPWPRPRARPAYGIVTGDTKVVNRGHGDGIYINTSGVGALAEGVNFGRRANSSR